MNLLKNLNSFLTEQERNLSFVERNTDIHYMKLWRFQNQTQEKLNSEDTETLLSFLAAEGYGE